MASACAPACQARSLGSGTRRVVAANRWVAAAAAAGPAATAAATAAAQAVPTHASDELGTRFDAADWERFLRGYQSLYEERSFAIDAACIEGTLPPELSGTLIRNGPGLFEVGGMQISQPFDGDGLVVLFAIRDGAVRVTWRYVRTQGFVAEQKAQRLLYRGAFSVGNPAGGWFNPFEPLQVKGVANTNVLNWAGKLLALFERDLPYELSPDLATLGQTMQLPTKAPFLGAHYRVVQGADSRKTLIAFNATEAGANNQLNFLEFDEAFNLLDRTEVELAGAAWGFIHDFGATPSYYVVLESPMKLDLWKLATKYMLGRACIAECIVWDGDRKKTRVHLIPRPGTTVQRRVFETEAFFSFHHANAYELDSAGGAPQVVVDTVAYPKGFDFSASMITGAKYYESDVGRGVLTRVVLDLQTGTTSQHQLMDRACEFPSVSPAVTSQPHRHVYVSASRFPGAVAWGAPQAVCKVSLAPEAGVTEPCAAAVDTYYAGRTQFMQEPIFVPRPGAQAEDDGWVLSLVFDADQERTKLVILDAQQLSAGPVATVSLPCMLPLGLHGCWTDAHLGPDQRAEPQVFDIRSGVDFDR